MSALATVLLVGVFCGPPSAGVAQVPADGSGESVASSVEPGVPDATAAIVRLRRAFDAEPRASILLDMADVYFAAGEVALALEYASLAQEGALSPDERARAVSLAALAERGTGRIDVVGPTGSIVLVDGVPPTRRFDPGEHVVRLEAHGRLPAEQRVEVREGETTTARFEDLASTPDVVAPPEPANAMWMLEDILALDVGVEVQADRPMWLFGRRVDRSGALAGPVQRLCQAPCALRMPAGRWAFGVADEEDGTPGHILWDSRLRDDSVVRIAETRVGTVRDVVAVLEAIFVPLAVTAVLVGAFTTDAQLQTSLLFSGSLVLVCGAAGLAVLLREDEISIGVVGGGGPPR